MARGILRRSVAVLAALAAALLTPVTAAADGPPVGSEPGRVESVEPLPAELGLPGTAQSYRLTYSTRDAAGRPSSSSGVVFVPAGSAPAGGWPVISWAHGTVGLGDACAPSRNPRTPRDATYLGHWLGQGYAIVATDYAGLGTPGVHPYLDGVAAAHSVVDMVRAGRAVVPELSPRWMVVGQSQGGHASLLTAHMATRYAPELDYRGAVTTGAPSNLENVYPFGGPWIPDLGLDGLTVFTSYILAGMRATMPGIDVNSYLTPLGRQTVDAAETLCYEAAAETVRGVSVGALLSRPLGDEPFRSALTAYLGVPTTGYDRPMFLGQGLLDTVVPAPLSFKLIVDLRLGGTDATYLNYPTDHSGTMAASLPDSTPFVRRLL
ncbi:lipase [Rhodococcus sp. ABRD24]|uniref:lipase family protein n=1 Tax=Rhodococcus sp. ABRD24 TaxID=2507582 RepID=UPI00103D0303|nr:lipase family protein [Rhodococcus sp. ABRD24]QBJ95084.1 lipase [Rhodococcus sp. ABRD24]